MAEQGMADASTTAGAAGGPPLIEVRGLCKSYPSSQLQDVDLGVAQGIVVGFVVSDALPSVFFGRRELRREVDSFHPQPCLKRATVPSAGARLLARLCPSSRNLRRGGAWRGA